ncbi:histidine kinase [Paenibacillus pasadenensis]|uniref:sensor histidine kinase n=1 Tax=Paenibacillus pasadenensis TaxID=217090 RepID=UPI00203E78DA|nr:histidine kinase [Paenibacillus pasadenensis]MCM3748583.1 histidine kinase [Paenibacillus pasadenensis]
MKFLKLLWPEKFKHRLFAAVLIFILVPVFFIQIYNYQLIQRSVSQEFSEKAAKQMGVVQTTFISAIQKLFLYYIYLERDPATHLALTEPAAVDESERTALLWSANRPASQDLPSFINVTLADRFGHIYESNEQMISNKDYKTFLKHPGFKGLSADGDSYRWVSGDKLSLFGVLTDNTGQQYGFLRIDFAYSSWFSDISDDLLLLQNYALLDKDKRPLSPSESLRSMNVSLVQAMIDDMGSQPVIQRTDERHSAILTASSIYNFDWYIVSSLPLSTYLGNMKEVRNQNIATFLLFSLICVAITFIIANAVSRPLALLQRNMAGSAAKELQTRVPERLFSGEMRDLALTYNQMMEDIQGLVHKLKLEERQKEALHYQMLMVQMNPHFLLNTLNTIKWNALDKNDSDTADICIALGKLLETSLNSDLELIYLKQEIELLRAYMYIQNFRFDGLVEVEFHLQEGTEHALIPKLSSQPLVENALKHAFPDLNGEARIIVRGYAEHQTLILEIEDNGIGLTKAGETARKDSRKGIGLDNVRHRLMLLFRKDGQLQLTDSGNGTIARISIPLLVSNPYQSEGD